MKKIYGITLDTSGRCIHYDLIEDVIANKCYYCKKYYACHLCHNQQENHEFYPWPIVQDLTDKVVLCGVCHHEMTYAEYTSFENCPNCEHAFNLNCRKHKHLYFT
ncbi:hypothetical protein BCR23_02175 [Enterococcus quebecensis]|uniref:CHY-type domain-containing protein n=1 Tax=Enterococcus quebecensis TaxID=903983 RepID=A0A1E5H3F9_9ENTE|nr:CHY zinc finger protein [Enterococcus quebecensis]OEG19518.1 hypothetical protein BCR23_02175 [Enterococcus quebecensis]